MKGLFMDEATRAEVSKVPCSFRATIEIYRLQSGKQVMIVDKGVRGASMSRSWDVSPGKPVSSVLNDAIPWLTKSLVDFFTSWGRI